MIKFIDLRFERWQVLGLRKASYGLQEGAVDFFDLQPNLFNRMVTY